MSQQAPSSYLKYLPAIFGTDASGQFLGQYLNIFEQVLTGLNQNLDLIQFSLILNDIPGYFTPYQERDEFVNWLAYWVGLVLKEEWDPARKQDIIANIIPLYRLRGTKCGLQQYLDLYTGGETAGRKVTITEKRSLFVVGEVVVGSTSMVGRGYPWYFEVTLDLSAEDPVLENGVKAIIEREKPAHTYYKFYVAIGEQKIDKTG